MSLSQINFGMIKEAFQTKNSKIECDHKIIVKDGREYKVVSKNESTKYTTVPLNKLLSCIRETSKQTDLSENDKVIVLAISHHFATRKDKSCFIARFVKSIFQALSNVFSGNGLCANRALAKRVASELKKRFQKITLTVGEDKNCGFSIAMSQLFHSNIKLKNLSRVAEKTVKAHDDINGIMGDPYFRWAASCGWKEEDIIQGHKQRIEALVKDLKEAEYRDITISNKLDYERLFMVKGSKAVVVSLCEGMGNQMCQAATGYALAKDLGVSFYGIQKKGVEHQSKLPPTLRRITMLEEEPCLPFKNCWGKNRLPVPKDLPRSWLIEGHLQAAENFDKYRAEILKLFAAPPEMIDALKNKYPEIHNKKTIAVHVRRGDYITLKQFGQLCFHNLLDEWQYYEQALKELGTEDAHVLIFSNDPEYCKKCT